MALSRLFSQLTSTPSKEVKDDLGQLFESKEKHQAFLIDAEILDKTPLEKSEKMLKELEEKHNLYNQFNHMKKDTYHSFLETFHELYQLATLISKHFENSHYGYSTEEAYIRNYYEKAYKILVLFGDTENTEECLNRLAEYDAKQEKDKYFYKPFSQALYYLKIGKVKSGSSIDLQGWRHFLRQQDKKYLSIFEDAFEIEQEIKTTAQARAPKNLQEALKYSLVISLDNAIKYYEKKHNLLNQFSALNAEQYRIEQLKFREIYSYFKKRFELDAINKHDNSKLNDWQLKCVYYTYILFGENNSIKDGIKAFENFLKQHRLDSLDDVLFELYIREFPEITPGQSFDLAGWRHFILENGMKGLAVFHYAPLIEVEIAKLSSDKKARAPKNLDEAYQVALPQVYLQSQDNIEFAKLCLNYNISAEHYEYGKQNIKEIIFSDNIPDVYVNGAEIGKPNYRMVKLKDPTLYLLFDQITHLQPSGNGLKYPRLKNTCHYVLLEANSVSTKEEKSTGLEWSMIAGSEAWMTRDGNITFTHWNRLRADDDKILDKMLPLLAKKLVAESKEVIRVTTGSKSYKFKGEAVAENEKRRECDIIYDWHERCVENEVTLYTNLAKTSAPTTAIIKMLKSVISEAKQLHTSVLHEYKKIIQLAKKNQLITAYSQVKNAETILRNKHLFAASLNLSNGENISYALSSNSKAIEFLECAATLYKNNPELFSKFLDTKDKELDYRLILKCCDTPKKLALFFDCDEKKFKFVYELIILIEKDLPYSQSQIKETIDLALNIPYEEKLERFEKMVTVMLPSVISRMLMMDKFQFECVKNTLDLIAREIAMQETFFKTDEDNRFTQLLGFGPKYTCHGDIVKAILDDRIQYIIDHPEKAYIFNRIIYDLGEIHVQIHNKFEHYTKDFNVRTTAFSKDIERAYVIMKDENFTKLARLTQFHTKESSFRRCFDYNDCVLTEIANLDARKREILSKKVELLLSVNLQIDKLIESIRDEIKKLIVPISTFSLFSHEPKEWDDMESLGSSFSAKI